MQKCSCKGCGKVISVVGRNRSIINCVKTFLEKSREGYKDQYKFETFGTLGNEKLNIDFRAIGYIKYDKKKIVSIPYDINKCIIGLDTKSVNVNDGTMTLKSGLSEMVARSIIRRMLKSWYDWEKVLKIDGDWNDDLLSAKDMDTFFAPKEMVKYTKYITGTKLYKKFLSMYTDFFKNPEFSYKLKDEFFSNISGYRSFIPILIVDFNKEEVMYYDDFLETDESKMKSIPLRTVIDGNKNSYIKYHIEIPFTMGEPKSKSRLVNSIDEVEYSDVIF